VTIAQNSVVRLDIATASMFKSYRNMQYETGGTLFPYTTLFRSIDLGKRLIITGDYFEVFFIVVAVFVLAGKNIFGNDDKKYLERSEEHTSELQSLAYIVCGVMLAK